MLGAGPHPNVNRQEMVRVDDLDLQLVYDDQGKVIYQVAEAGRFGDKIAEGDLKYADFAPHESASAISRFNGTYGLRRYTDAADPTKEQDAIFEADGMDCSIGLPIMEPEQSTETLPGNGATIQWIGEFTPTGGQPTLVAVAGVSVYKRTGPGTWVLAITLPFPVLTGAAVASFNGRLLFGFGTAGTAKYTADLATTADVTTSAPAPMYVYALMADHSNIYAVGGATASTSNQVMSSTTGLLFATPILCGRPEVPIQELAPGGGLVLAYVGKQNELGYIDNDALYHVLIPFDTYETHNGTLLRWWMGRQDDQQRGFLSMHFLRDRQLWEYAPSAQDTGEARNITVWADPSRRPSTIKGLATAIAGTNRWLYYAITNAAGTTWILKRDAVTSITTPYLSVGANRPTAALVVTHAVGLNPCLMYGAGADIRYVTLPANGEWPLDDANCAYKVGTATLTMPEFELLLPDEDKIALSFRVLADSLAEDVRYFTVEYSVDGGALQALGTAFTSPMTELVFDKDLDTVKGKRVLIKLTAHNADRGSTMVLRGIVLRWSLNAKPYLEWTFQAMLPPGRTQLPGTDLDNAQRKIRDIWALRESGLPFVFVDRWRASYITRVKTAREIAASQERTRTPETIMEIVLIQTTGALPSNISDLWSMALSTTSWFPITACWPVVGPGTLNGVGIVSNVHTDDIFPRWTVTGPAGLVTLTNTTTGKELEIEYDLPFGATMVIVTDPTRRIVVDENGTALAATVTGTYWGFTPGLNNFTVQVAAASAPTTVRLQRRA